MRCQARLAANVPRTIENTRLPNPTIINAPNTHPGPGPSTSAASIPVADGNLEEDVATAQVQDHDTPDEDDDPHAPPSLLITTSLPSNSTSPHLTSANARSHPAARVREFVDELLNIFPGAEYRPRAKAKGAGLGKICGWARGRGFNAVLVIGEDKKEPVSLTIVGLPTGPTAFFRLTSLSIGKEIYGHARSTPHTPELILNNFTTTLGHSIGRLLQQLFPRVPELEGRQVITAHNQRDFIFFRRHRYMFRRADKTALQEIGPRFTLKLRSLKQGLPKGAGVWNGQTVPDADEGQDDYVVAEAGSGEGDLEVEAAQSLEEGAEAQGEDRRTSKSASQQSSAPDKVKRKRGAEEEVGMEFQWKVGSFSGLSFPRPILTRLFHCIVSPSPKWASADATSTFECFFFSSRSCSVLYSRLCHH